jgi:hypothetical protein
MMLQPTSGRRGFDYVDDQTDEKGKKNRLILFKLNV